MAVHVVVVTPDSDVRTVLDTYLHSEGHVVLTALEEQQALSALQVGRYPAVVIVHAPSPAYEGLGLLQRAASSASGQLARHRYIVLVPNPAAMPSARRAQLARLKARVIALPFGLEEVAAAVGDAGSETARPAS